MSTETQQQYIVHLDVEAIAVDATAAVQVALAEVRQDGLGTFTWSVEEVGIGPKLFIFPVPRRGSANAVHGTFGDACYSEDNQYHGEFLG